MDENVKRTREQTWMELLSKEFQNLNRISVRISLRSLILLTISSHQIMKLQVCIRTESTFLVKQWGQWPPQISVQIKINIVKKNKRKKKKVFVHIQHLSLWFLSYRIILFGFVLFSFSSIQTRFNYFLQCKTHCQPSKSLNFINKYNFFWIFKGVCR